MKSKPVEIKPRKVEKSLPPAHYYPELDLSYEELNRLAKEMKEVDKSFQAGQTRQIIHEIYLYANGVNTVADMAEKIGFEFGIRIKPEHLLPLIQSLERYGSLTIKGAKKN